MNTLETSFAARLREGTREVHTRAERTAFISGFLRGLTSLESYARLLAALHPVYVSMERALEEQSLRDPLLAPFNQPRLRRAAALERDLEHIAGTGWRTRVQPVPEAALYVARIHDAVRESPALLVGHLYTRQLGDLAGGQVLARIAGRCLGLGSGAGLDFYDFGNSAELPDLRSEYRRRLDTLGRSLPEPLRVRVVAEAVAAFRHNIAVFRRLEGSALVSLLRALSLPGFRPERHRAAGLGPAAAH